MAGTMGGGTAVARRWLLLLVAFAATSACAGSSSEPESLPPLETLGRSASTTENSTTENSTTDGFDRVLECDSIRVSEGHGPVPWIVDADGAAGFMAGPAAVSDGFVVGSDNCTAFVQPDGTIRWSRSTGWFVGATEVDDVVIVVMSPSGAGAATVVGYEAGTGATRWENRTVGIWSDVRPLGDHVVVSGLGPNGAMILIDAATGANRSPIQTSAMSAFPARSLRVESAVVIGMSDQSGEVAIIDESGELESRFDVAIDYPEPVGATASTIAIQSTGTSTNAGQPDPSTRLAGHDRASGAERWRLDVSGDRARSAVQIGQQLIVCGEDAVTAIDIDTGSVEWVANVPSYSESRVLPLGDGGVAVSSLRGVVTALELADGTQRWQRVVEGEVARLHRRSVGDLLLVDSTGRYLDLDRSTGAIVSEESGPTPAGGFVSVMHHLELAVEPTRGSVAATLGATETGLGVLLITLDN